MYLEELRNSIIRREERWTVPLVVLWVIVIVAVLAAIPAILARFGEAMVTAFLLGSVLLAVALLRWVSAKLTTIGCPQCKAVWTLEQRQGVLRSGRCCHCQEEFPRRTGPAVTRVQLALAEQIQVASAAAEAAHDLPSDNPYAASYAPDDVRTIPELWPLRALRMIYAGTIGLALPRRRGPHERSSEYAFYGNPQEGFALSTPECQDRAHRRQRLVYLPLNAIVPTLITFVIGPGAALWRGERPLDAALAGSIAVVWLGACFMGRTLFAAFLAPSLPPLWLEGTPAALWAGRNAEDDRRGLSVLLNAREDTLLPTLRMWVLRSTAGEVRVQLIHHATAEALETRRAYLEVDRWQSLVVDLQEVVDAQDPSFETDELRLSAPEEDAELWIAMLELRPPERINR